MLFLTTSILVLGFAILAFFAYSLSRIIRSARKQNTLSQSVEDCLETARIIADSEESQPQTYGTISSATSEMPHPHLEASKSIGKTIIPQNTSTTLRVPSICDGLSNIFSTSVTRASSITFHDSSSDSERSDTPTVPSDSVGVIQDLELEIKDSRKENHDLRSALEVALSANAAHLQTISEMVHAVCAEDEVNRELVKQIERLLKRED
ncbi:hypothetical protein QFC20_004909 [Naganishia adeliensis]|uniref:Uncharacterized protein n=1 Tax=Naganishia adeliensis TaxID=92952 RepID=A0ACC2VTS7_9TREE|nr:hypothetical protein QFC20_004909 [Naganishia adeliensis]